MRDRDLIRVFYQITMTMSFNNSPRVPINPPQSCHIGGWRGSGQSHEGFQWDRLGGEKNEWSRMSSCDLIRFSITVSSNHSEWRDAMKGCWKSDEQMKEFWGEERDRVVAWCGCVWNVMKPGTSLRVSHPPPILKLFYREVCWRAPYPARASKHSRHLWLCFLFSATQSLDWNDHTVTVGVSHNIPSLSSSHQ